MSTSRPNILLIHSDQHRYDCIGTHGHPLLQTPNLDRLAAEGIDFTHAFCSSPICCPARASMLTGQWPVQHGLLFTEIAEAYRPMKRDRPTFSQLLRDAGYYLGYVGKWHVDEVATPLDFGFHDYVPEATYTEWRASQGLRPCAHHNGWFGEADTAIEPGQSRIAWAADETRRLMRQASATGQPFFIRWDPSEPHLPNRVPEPYASLYPPEEIPPWPSFGDPLWGKPTIQRTQLRNWDVEGWPWARWAPTVGRYLGEITLLDHQIGRVLAELEALGVADNTLVVYTTDHGDMCGAHGMMDKHYVMYDDVVRVPLIMRWPAVVAAGQVNDTFVSSAIDLASTFCHAAGLPIPGTFTGESLLRSATDSRQEHPRPDIYSTYFGNQFGMYSQRMVRDRRWKFIWNPTAEDELYDLAMDPAELHNLAGDPAASTELDRLRDRMVWWLRRTGDPLLNQWTERQLIHRAAQDDRSTYFHGWAVNDHAIVEGLNSQRHCVV